MKEDLLTRIEQTWTAWQAIIGGLSQPQLADLRDDQGWSIKDHVAHITAWEQSLLALLEGRNRLQAMGLGGEADHSAGVDAINDRVRQLSQGQSLAGVMAEAAESHRHVLARLAAMSDDDLIKPYSHYQPDDLPHNPNPVVGWIEGNTCDHYQEHIGWVRRLLERA